MEIVLVPGLWLNAHTWDAVTPELEGAGHRVQALTLPGMQDRATDRTGVTLADHVDAVVAALDAAEGTVLLVGHSAGCGIAHAALDVRPDRVARAVHIGGWPTPDGGMLLSGLPAEGGEVAMPDWREVGEEANVADFDDAALEQFYAAAIPAPEQVLTTPVVLRDERRLDVPATMVCPEYTADQLRAWLADGEESLAEVARLRDVDYVDLPGGHWPQVTQPEALSRVLLDLAARTSAAR